MFLHVDMEYFFAQIEELRHPLRKEKIIVVCVYSGRTEDSGVVSTVNYEGRKYGLRSGMPIAMAKKRAPPADTLFLPVDRDHYKEISSGIDKIIRKYSPKVAQASIDEWNLEVDRIPEETARAIKKEIFERTELSCSVGCAPSPLGAKMAANAGKPNGLTILNRKEQERFIETAPVEKVPGIGAKTGEALRALGVKTVADLKKHEAIELVDRFGRKTGAWLHELSQGEYGKSLEDEKEQSEISRYGSLKDNTRDSYLIMLGASEQEKEARDWLKVHGRSYRTLTMMFITDDMKTHTKSLSFRNPRGPEEAITGEMMSLVDSFLQENKRPVRRVGVRFSHFEDMTGQTKLF